MLKEEGKEHKKTPRKRSCFGLLGFVLMGYTHQVVGAPFSHLGQAIPDTDPGLGQTRLGAGRGHSGSSLRFGWARHYRWAKVGQQTGQGQRSFKGPCC